MLKRRHHHTRRKFKPLFTFHHFKFHTINYFPFHLCHEFKWILMFFSCLISLQVRIEMHFIELWQFHILWYNKLHLVCIHFWLENANNHFTEWRIIDDVETNIFSLSSLSRICPVYGKIDTNHSFEFTYFDLFEPFQSSAFQPTMGKKV